MNLSDIFIRRSRQSTDLFLRNAKYIFNDHAVLVMFFLLGALSFQYSQWVGGLTAGQVSLPIHLIWSVIISVGVFLTGIASQILPADLVFLLPIESRFDEWFKPALNRSLYLPSAIILMMVAASYPLLSVMAGYSVVEVVVLALILICYKVAHVYILMESWHFHRASFIRNHKWALYAMVLVTVFLASYVTPYLCLGIVLMYLVAIHFLGIQPFKPGKVRWHWEKIVTVEQTRQQQIRRMLALFINMPQEAAVSKRRKYYDGLIRLSDKDTNPYTYLFTRAFWRSNDFYPLWLRMTLVGVLYLAFVANNHWLNIGVVLLIQYFSHLQVLPLAQKMNQHTLLQVYPIDHSQKIAGFTKMLRQPLCTQIVLFALTSLIFHAWTFTGLLVVSSIVFSLFLIFIYVPSFMRKKEKRRG